MTWTVTKDAGDGGAYRVRPVGTGGDAGGPSVAACETYALARLLAAALNGDYAEASPNLSSGFERVAAQALQSVAATRDRNQHTAMDANYRAQPPTRAADRYLISSVLDFRRTVDRCPFCSFTADGHPSDVVAHMNATHPAGGAEVWLMATVGRGALRPGGVVGTAWLAVRRPVGQPALPAAAAAADVAITGTPGSEAAAAWVAHNRRQRTGR